MVSFDLAQYPSKLSETVKFIHLAITEILQIRPLNNLDTQSVFWFKLTSPSEFQEIFNLIHDVPEILQIYHFDKQDVLIVSYLVQHPPPH